MLLFICSDMISDIRTRVIVDGLKDGRGIIEEGKEYVNTGAGMYFHVIVAANFQPDFRGTLRMAIAHSMSDFKTYQIVPNPPRHLLEYPEFEGELCFGSPGIPLPILLGTSGSVESSRSTVSVTLFLDNKEISHSEFPVIKGSFS